jgi:nucleoside-diphosphate-sugar epimerase
MRVLFIGGTGVISTACSKLCVERGMNLWLLNRGNHPERMPKGVGWMAADINDVEDVKKMLGGSKWDCVVDWTVMNADHAKRDIELFIGKTKQFIFINSTCVYKAPPLGHRLVETDPLVSNPIWDYTRSKLEAEKFLLAAKGFPLTVARPGHTYCEFTIPTNIPGLGYGLVERLKQGKEVIVHDDGLSLWTLTHSSDVAVGLVGLIGRDDAIGEIFHITHTEALTWLDIFETYAEALDVKPNFIFIPSTRIYQIDYELGASLLGHRALSKIFDNSKIKRFVKDFDPKVSFAEGIRKSLEWHRENKGKIYYNRQSNEAVDRIIQTWQRQNDYQQDTL